jgi:lipoprotein-releasing system ATP-binding protein
MLIADRIAKSYPTRTGELVVLREANLSVSAGAAAVIVGPSGCGKSTLLNILGTLEPPTAGTLRIADDQPLQLKERELARFRNRRIGFVFQEHYLLPQCSAAENVLLPALAERGTSDGDPHVRARELLTRVGLANRSDHRPAELSGGERQRVAIARALINRPALLLADEPTGNLDRRTAEGVAELLSELLTSERFALVLVTHSEALAARFQHRYEIDDGRLTLLTATASA